MSDTPKFKIGDTVRKTKGSQWSGKVVGTYSTELTPEGYAVESSTERGSVQIYPAAALESCCPPLASSGARLITFGDLTELARQAVVEGRLNWAGFKADEAGEYMIPAISPMEFNLVNLALAASSQQPAK